MDTEDVTNGAPFLQMISHIGDNTIYSSTSMEENSGISEMDGLNEPCKNMLFDSFEEAYDFYLNYAKRIGFGVKKTQISYTDKGILGPSAPITRGTIACCKSGKAPDRPHHEGYFSKVSAKTNCPAKIRLARRQNSGKYQIVAFVKEHNHELLKQHQLHMLRCNRKAQLNKLQKVAENDKSGVGDTKTVGSFVIETGGCENVGFRNTDARTTVKKSRSLILGEGDAQALQKYILDMQSKNFNFFYLLDLDDSGCLKNVFWADPRSRAVYKFFGDVITFDTTYLTNKYCMPFVSFVGVNHHGQSVLMGCALLSEESTENYTWLLETWLRCMGGRHPDAIITDHSTAIMDAVSKVLPTTRHRLCLWHIMENSPNKFDLNAEALEKFKNVVYESMTAEDFEREWKQMVLEGNLQEHSWLSQMYNLRKMWIPAYVKQNFWAGMSTTQRSESMGSFFDGLVCFKTTLKQFIQQYEMALQSKHEKEIQADFDSLHERQTLQTRTGVEEHLSNVYTTGIFRKCREELLGMIYCDVTLLENNGSSCTYNVSERIRRTDVDPPIVTRKNHHVVFNESTQDISCVCQMFNYCGILCRHAMIVLQRRDIDEIPPQYIVDRWKKNVQRIYDTSKTEHPVESVLYLDPFRRHDAVVKFCLRFAEEAAVSHAKFNKSMALLQNAFNQLTNDASEGATFTIEFEKEHLHNMNNSRSAVGSGGDSDGYQKTVYNPKPLKKTSRPPKKQKVSIKEKRVRNSKDGRD